MIGFKNTDKWAEASDRLDEMSNEKLKAYRAAARKDGMSKVDSNRKKSISRYKGAQKAEYKIMSRPSKNTPANDNAYNNAKHLQKKMNEDGMAVPVNNAGSGNIAGAGVGPNGEPGVSKKKTPKLLKNVLQRKLP